MRAPLAPPRLSEPRKVEAEAQAVPTSSDTDRPVARIFAFRAAMSLASTSGWSAAGHRVLPEQRFLRHLGAEVARARTEVAVRELEPGAGEGIGEGLRVLVEAARDGAVDRIHAQREVRRGHDGLDLLRRVVRGRREVLVGRIHRLPLPGAGRALHEVPVVAEEHVEVAHVPLRRVRRPRAFDAAAGGVTALPAAQGILPAETHFFEGRSFRLGADQLGVGGAVASCRRCGRRRPGRRFPRRSWPCGGRSRGCRGRRRARSARRWGLRGSHR